MISFPSVKRNPFPRRRLYVSMLVIFLLTPQILNMRLIIGLQVLKGDFGRRHLKTYSDSLGSIEIGSTSYLMRGED